MKISLAMRFVVPAALFLLVSGNHCTMSAQSGVQSEIEKLKKQIAARQAQINSGDRLRNSRIASNERASFARSSGIA